MHLIAPLISGIRGAENGTVGIFKRATGTRATYYVDFEATQAVTPTADLSLDANGAIEIYVNELVDVVVKSSGGTTLRTFTAGYAPGNIEVRSQSFTGNDYVTALSAAGNPTTLQAVLDLIKGSFGTTDFNVLLNGVPTSVKDALGGKFALNVKDYGAKGDNSTDDTAAIQATLDAVPASGGWVYFPAGTYRTTSALTMYSTVNLLGDGHDLSKIAIDHATAKTMESTQTENGPRFIIGLHFKPLQANTGTVLSWTTTSHRVVIGCAFGDTSTRTLKGIAIATSGSAGTSWKIVDCRFDLGLGGRAVSGTDTHVRDCMFTMGTGAHTGTVITLAGNGTRQASGFVSGCEFDVSGPTGSTFSVIDMGANPRGSVTGCTFSDVGAASTVTAITLGSLTSCWFHESGNAFFPATGSPNEPLGTLLPYAYTAPAYNSTGMFLLATRNMVQQTVTQTGGGTKTLAADLYGVILLRVGDGTAFALQATKGPVGARLIVITENTTGLATGNITPGNTFRDVGVYTVIANSIKAQEFVSMPDIQNTTVHWLPTSDRSADF